MITSVIISLSMSVLLGLIILRVTRDFLRLRTAKRKNEITQYLLIHLANPLKNLRALSSKDNSDMKILADVLLPMLKNLKGQAREDLLRSMQEVGFYDWLINRLRKRSGFDLVKAIIILSFWHDEKTKNELRHLLKISKVTVVKLAIIESLSEAKDPKDFPLILSEFEGKNKFSYPVICDVFARFGNQISDKLLALVKQKKTSTKVAMAALMALSRHGNSNDILQAANLTYRHNNKELRALAFAAFAKSAQSISPKILGIGCRDEYWRTRFYALSCAININPFPAKIVADLLGDKNWMVAMQSAKVLISIGEPGWKILKTISQNSSKAGQRAKLILQENHDRSPLS